MYTKRIIVILRHLFKAVNFFILNCSGFVVVKNSAFVGFLAKIAC